MKTSTRWFKSNEEQIYRTTGTAQFPVLTAFGPNIQVDPDHRKNENGDKLFVVGESEVGGEEVVG